MPFKGGRRDKATIKYARDVYTPEGAKSLSEHDLKKEYSRLRSIAQKRLKRFEGTEWTSTEAYKQNKDEYKKLSDIKSNRELRHLFSELATFTLAQTSRVSGLEKQRKNAIITLHDRGYNFVNKENFKQFTDFMEYARVSNLNKLYDSKRIADFFEDAHEKRNLSNEELRKAFRSWTRKQKKVQKIQNINPRNSSMYRKDVK